MVVTMGQQTNGRMYRPEDTLFDYMLGKELSNKVGVLMHGRSVDKLRGFRDGLQLAVEQGGFVVVPNPEDPLARNGNDENKTHRNTRQLIELVGIELADRIIETGRSLKMSNLSVLRVGVQAALDRGAM